MEWIAIPFSRESYWPRNQTQVSCTVGGFFTIWATRALSYTSLSWVDNENHWMLVRNNIHIYVLFFPFHHAKDEGEMQTKSKNMVWRVLEFCDLIDTVLDGSYLT